MSIIMKETMLYNAASTDVVVNLAINSAALSVGMFIARVSIPSGDTQIVSHWTVMQSGDSIYIQTSSGGVSVWISGTLLQGVPNYTQPPVGMALPAQQLALLQSFPPPTG